VTTTAELVLDRDHSPIASASATFVKVAADVEAAWRARYVRDPEMVPTEPRRVPPNAAGTSEE
jgi:hypothetical protein